jgi:hypothetical protein
MYRGIEMHFKLCLEYLGGERHKWENAIKMDLKEICCKDVNLIELFCAVFLFN